MTKKTLIHLSFKKLFWLNLMLLVVLTLFSGVITTLLYVYKEAFYSFSEEFGLVGILLACLVLNIFIMSVFINVLNWGLKLVGGIDLVFEKK